MTAVPWMREKGQSAGMEATADRQLPAAARRRDGSPWILVERFAQRRDRVVERLIARSLVTVASRTAQRVASGVPIGTPGE